MPGRGLGERDIVVAFNEAINRGDLEALTGLMADDHRFVDAAGSVVAGKEACREAWASFFAAYPDHRNVFDTVEAVDGRRVVAIGRSECSLAALAGPAVWTATVVDGLITEWRVDDRPGAR
jgi:ketosteroid isomerase-like protein